MSIKLVEDRWQWTQPRSLPNLRRVRPKLIAYDLETNDEGIQAGIGPGGVLGMGYIVGLAIALDDGYSGYFPIRHANTKNFSIEEIRDWASDNLTLPIPKVGANIKYDLEWSRAEGIAIAGPFRDVQIAEPLIDENARRYNLGVLSAKYLPDQYHKLTDTLSTDGLAYLGKAKGNIYEHLAELPARIVGPYAEMDAVSTLMIFQEQIKQIEAQDLGRVFDIESRLTPLLLDMRFQGVRVDTKRTEQAVDDIQARVDKGYRKLKRLCGLDINVNAADSIAKGCDKLGIHYPRTAKTDKPSFVKDWMEAHDSPFINLVKEVRTTERTKETFLKSSILGHAKKGRVHTEFNQLKSDEAGTVTGRYSSSNPNLQQVPSREEVNADLLRSLFIPEPGEDWWRIDYSQIEYRLMVHFASVRGLRGADRARKAYCENPDTDFHEWVAGLINRPRKLAKNINFGLAYLMGAAKLARSLGLPLEESYDLLKFYHDEVPFIKLLSKDVQHCATERGYIRTLSGRRRRFPLWEPRGQYGKMEKNQPALPQEAAYAVYGPNIQRAFTYKAMNSLIQGSAADQMKIAMVQTYEAGCYAKDALGHVPSLTVHDELDGSMPRTKRAKEALREVIHIMQTCVKLEVPVIAEAGTGKDWWNVNPFN